MTSTAISTNYTNKTKKLNAEAEQIPEPDSTTTLEKDVNEFCAGQEVLVKRIDEKEKIEKFFLGTVVEVNVLQEKCLVKYGDNTNHWAGFKDLTKLSTPEQEDLLCVVCKKSAPKSKREIISCDKCGRGYHKKCHQPEIPFVCQKSDSNWMCCRCLHNEPKKLRMSDIQSRRNSLRSISSVESDSQVNSGIKRVKTLPYDLSSLSWDTNHRVNTEQIYCYCGGNGEWYKQMLQCGRCRQWFHEECIESLKYPVYCGDRFYVFVCSVCNHGKEFVRRLEMKWDDLVHLMLYNLTVYHSKKYYDLDSVILPYINDNWHALQLPATVFAIAKNERRGHILSVLRNNRTRFKCGREIKKKTTIWGLRVRLPPPAPYMTLPQTGRILENDLRILWQGNSRLRFLPLIIGDSRLNTRCKRVLSNDTIMSNLMMGMTYKSNGALSESESPCPSPEVDDEKRPDNTLKLDNYIGKGCVKKSVPFPKMSMQIRKRLLQITTPKDKILRKAKRRQTISDLGKNKEEREKGRGAYLTRLSLDSKSNSNKSNESLPLTPPTSVSSPPTPPASGSTSTVSDLSNDCLESASVKDVKVGKPCPDTNSLTELNTQCDTSGDETSSKSTLDLIIPPPKDFEGKNNPFLAFLRGQNDGKKKKRRSKDSITLPLPLTAVIPGKPNMRPTKRQLSEKDIIIGPNGEVKRKRLRRNNKSAPNYVAGQTASKTAAVVPIKPDNKDWSAACSSSAPGSENFFGGRRLRQRPEKPADKEKTPNPPTPKPSPVKAEPDISMDELKSSVNIYFGAANRIAAGERFTLKAKRYGPTGKLEYLIEWDGPSSNGLT
ncbi:uncharacterized protein LOC123676031 [Harmonia axyridis]|uniref:uncharacterized protein LOC123676031 n=1 Tax=Harmonia axyridis TaxID=115357 RepID=UPI001E277FC8|nr:uncharacterized protein LOC123676031 [Harmonia axyridis]XP_045467631.1 uncharacterized protein LOC123676031 [Harmonia axyridis]XP_045467632.1 uncharacterized protein LOC123676031 [Harmonia axyridis]